jgi:hypothetical protein
MVGKTEEKRPLRKFPCRWEDNIKMNAKEIEHEGVVCIYLAQNRGQWRNLVNTAINLRIPYRAGNMLTR